MDDSHKLYEMARNAATPEEAIALYQRSADIFPHFKTLELLGELLLKTGKPKEAIVPLAAATTLNKQVRAPSLLAEALLMIGERQKARDVARLALKRDQRNKKAIEIIGETEDLSAEDE
jgi:tetratricopeptide (TPR) repeat protein